MSFIAKKAASKKISNRSLQIFRAQKYRTSFEEAITGITTTHIIHTGVGRKKRKRSHINEHDRSSACARRKRRQRKSARARARAGEGRTMGRARGVVVVVVVAVYYRASGNRKQHLARARALVLRGCVGKKKFISAL